MKLDSKTRVTKEDRLLQNHSVRFSDLLLTIAFEIKLVLLFPFLFCMVTIFYVTFISKPEYSSTSKIISSSNSGGVSQAAGLAAQFGINIGSNQNNQKWMYPEVIKSKIIARSLLKKKFKTNFLGPNKDLFQILTFNLDHSKYSSEMLQIIASQKLIKMINVSENVKTGINTVTINAAEPQFAKEINSALLISLDKYQKDYNKSKTSEARQFIEERIAETEKSLKTAEEELKNFRERNRRIENSPSLQLEQERLGREVTVLIGVYTTLKQQLETTKIEEVKDSDYIIVLDPPEIPLIRSKPKKKVAVILSVFLGLFIGILSAFLKEFYVKSDQKEKEKYLSAKNVFLSNLFDIFPKRKR